KSPRAAGAAPGHAWSGDPLPWLIGPTSSSEFLERHYERPPLVVARDDPHRFRDLLSIAAIDRLVAGADLREGMLDLADASRRLRVAASRSPRRAGAPAARPRRPPPLP